MFAQRLSAEPNGHIFLKLGSRGKRKRVNATNRRRFGMLTDSKKQKGGQRLPPAAARLEPNAASPRAARSLACQAQILPRVFSYGLVVLSFMGSVGWPLNLIHPNTKQKKKENIEVSSIRS